MLFEPYPVPKTQAKSLTEVLALLGVEPVSLEFLEAHKRDQEGRHGPSFWYRHQNLYLLVVLAMVGSLVVAGLVWCRWLPISSSFVYWALAVTAVFAGFVVYGGVFGYPGAHWGEVWLPNSQLLRECIPESIVVVAQDLRRVLPGSFTLGKLLRNDDVLDPYLLFQYEKMKVCLGVWEEDGTVVACAKRPYIDIYA